MKLWGNRLSLICGLVASVFLTGMLLLTVADVLLRDVFGYTMRGVYELIELLLAGTFFFALPCVYFRDDNILVNTVDDYFPRIVPLLKRCALLFSVAVFVVLVWQGWFAAKDSFEFHDVTADLGLPRFWHWTIVLVGMVGAALAALFMFFLGDDGPAEVANDLTQDGA